MAIKKVYIGEKPSDIQFNVTAKVGTTGDKPTDADRGKPFKLAGDSTFVRCVDGDPIEAILTALEPHTADGVMVGTVKTGGYKEAIMVGTAWTVGAFVVAAAQAAAGVNNDAAQFPRPKVKVDAAPEGPFLWRIVSVVSGAVGADGAVVTLQRV